MFLPFLRQLSPERLIELSAFPQFDYYKASSIRTVEQAIPFFCYHSIYLLVIVKSSEDEEDKSNRGTAARSRHSKHRKYEPHQHKADHCIPFAPDSSLWFSDIRMLLHDTTLSTVVTHVTGLGCFNPKMVYWITSGNTDVAPKMK